MKYPVRTANYKSPHRNKRDNDHYYFEPLSFGMVGCIGIDKQNRSKRKEQVDREKLFKRDIVSQDRIGVQDF